MYLHNYKDHLNPDLIKLKNSQITATKNVINIPAVNKSPKGFILYEGIGLEVDPYNNYVFPVLRADDNTYSINTKSGQSYNNGEKIKLVTAYQARNNRRVVVTGSTGLCSDKFFFLSSPNGLNPTQSPNANFCKDIVSWEFQRNGVLRFENIRHHRVSFKIQICLD